MRIDLNKTAASQIANEPNAKQVSAITSPRLAPRRSEDRTTFKSDTQSLSSLVSSGNEFA